jgi:hypothetical protein
MATAKIAKQVKRIGIRVSAKTVGRLLKQMKFSLRWNLKCLESEQSKPPNPHQRDQQFHYIRNQIRACSTQGLPVISVDTKSRELIGPFHQSGRRWSQEPIKVLDHDLSSDSKEIASPYGICPAKM